MNAIQATGTLLRLFFTSPSFQSLITEAILVVRDILAESAGDIASAAKIVAEGAEHIEETLKPSEPEKEWLHSHPSQVGGIPPVEPMIEDQKAVGEKAKALAIHTAAETRDAWESAKASGNSDKIKAAMLDRVNQVHIQCLNANACLSLIEDHSL